MIYKKIYCKIHNLLLSAFVPFVHSVLFLQSPGYNSAIEKEGGSTDELSLALYEMSSLPEFLPVLSVIPEVSWT
jgi:hypothetical protein